MFRRTTPRQCSFNWYTSRYMMTSVYIHMQFSHQAHVVQYGPPTHPDMRRVSWGQSAQTTRRSELCIIAIGHPFALQSAQQHRSEGAKQVLTQHNIT